MKIMLKVGFEVKGKTSSTDPTITSRFICAEALVSLPGLPYKGAEFFLDPIHEFTSQVSEIRWYPSRTKRNVMDPRIDLYDIDWNSDVPDERLDTLENEIARLRSDFSNPLAFSIQFKIT